MSTVIRIENLSKRYRLGVVGSTMLSTDLNRWWARLRGKPDPTLKIGQEGLGPRKGEHVWALKDVSLDVKEAEILGIIGRNGAGKSTLLKILTRITAPTSGIVRLKGRVASLLEVGTGFHPELTGRENIHLNGSILGMTKSEIVEKLDEIVAFAEIEEFIDTPVKRYSSGMYVRLAFAVAAHLEPEILLVDEVLAVGDLVFQKKCLGKMGSVARDGRTVLLVSHNMGAIHQLCPKCVWLDNGRVRDQGATAPIVSAYLKSADASRGAVESVFAEDLRKEAQVRRVRLLDENEEPAQKFSCDEPITVDFLFQVHRPVPGLYGYLDISKADGTRILVSDSFDAPPNPLDNLDKGMYSIRIIIPARSLGPGDYRVYLNFTSDRASTWNVDSPGIVCTFRLDDLSSRRGNNRGGCFSTLLNWHVNRSRG